MLELAHQGAQVMQTRAVELGWVNGVVIEVLSSFEDAPGTLIKEDPFVEQRNKVRGLAHDRNVAKVTLVEVPDKPGVGGSVFQPLAEAGINVDMIVQNIGHGGATDLSFTIPQVELAKAKRILEPVARELGFREMTTDSSVAKVSIVGAGIQNAPGYAARMFGALADAGVNIEMISTSEIRITTIIAEDALETAVRALHEAFELERPEAIEAAAARLMIRSPFLARQERFAVVGSTNDVVRGWLADGVPEVCLAVADEQTAGRGRDGRTLDRAAGSGAPPVARLPADLARAGAGLAARGGRRASRWPTRPRRSPALAPGTIRLKWPNDLVVESGRRRPQAGRRPRRDRRPRDGRSAGGRRDRDQRGLAGGRLPAGAGRDDDVAAGRRGRPAGSTRRDLLDAFTRALEPRSSDSGAAPSTTPAGPSAR